MVLLARVPDLFYHYQDWDEAAMMSQAWAMTRGQVLYRDTFQIHPVLNFAIFYPFFALLPADAAAHAVKGFNLVLAAAAVLGVYTLGRRWTGDARASLLAGAMVAHYLGRRWGLSSYGEFYLLLPIVASVWLLFFRPRRSRLSLLCVGAFWAMAFFIKQVAIFDAAGLVLGYLWLDADPPARKARAAGWIALGAMLAGAAVAIMLARNGILSIALRETLLGPAAHYAQPVGAGAALLARIAALAGRAASGLAQAIRVLPIPFMAAALAVPAVLWAARRGKAPRWIESGTQQSASGRELAGILAVWLGVDLLGLLVVAKFYPHYLVQILPPLCLLAACPIARLRNPAKTALAAISLLTLLGGSGFVFAKTLIQDRGEPARVRQSRDIAARVGRMSGPEDRIFLYRFRGLDVFYLAGRLSSNGIYMFIDMFPEHIKDERAAADRQRMLFEQPPRLIVTDPGGLLLGCDSAEPLFRRLLSERYCLRERRGPIEIHELCKPAYSMRSVP